MRTVTTEDNPYKVAGDILFASSEVESDFRSVDLYGSSVRRKKEDAICSRFHLENESGTGDIAVYQTFPGMELVYNDMHMEYCNKMQSPRPGFIEINYCREGRCECAFGERSYCYMAAGNLSICTLHKKSHTSTFPTSHYHGITITIELEEITDEMRRILKLLSINLTRISEFAGKQDFYMVRANETVQHIFSELYTVQEHIKPSYIRIKLTELVTRWQWIWFLSLCTATKVWNPLNHFSANSFPNSNACSGVICSSLCQEIMLWAYILPVSLFHIFFSSRKVLYTRS